MRHNFDFEKCITVRHNFDKFITVRHNFEKFITVRHNFEKAHLAKDTYNVKNGGPKRLIKFFGEPKRTNFP